MSTCRPLYLPKIPPEDHDEPHFDLITWLGVYRAGTPAVRGGDNATLRLDLDNEPQPDGYLRLHAYRRNGVREYVVWRVWDAVIDWFVLREGRFEPLQTRDGIYRSEVLPGLWLASDAVLRGDLARVLAVLQQGLASPEHAAFVAGFEQR